MPYDRIPNPFRFWKQDASAALVVFLIALPLNLGIAMASNAPLSAGIISGIVGGIVVGLISGSALSVSGPAAGLTMIVFNAIEVLPSYSVFLTAVVLAGIIQIAFGLAKVGWISLFFPSAVIKGMLAAIGIVIVLKQIPHLLGLDSNDFGEMEFFQKNGENTFSEIFQAFLGIEPGPLIIGLISVAILLLWNWKKVKRLKFFKLLPGPLVVVLIGLLLKIAFDPIPILKIEKAHLVSLPVVNGWATWFAELSTPDWSYLLNTKIWMIAFTLALVASLETLLSVEAIDKIDPEHRQSPKNRELFAQGAGNIVTGFLGGIPISAVVVRSSANLDSGARTKLSAILHGVLLAVCFFLIVNVLNQIPLASLAAILLFTGYKLSRPILYRSYLRLGKNQYRPFFITIIAILLTDLLIGMVIGLAVGLYYILKAHYQTPFSLEQDQEPDSGKQSLIIHLGEIVSFLNKSHFRNFLDQLPSDSKVVIDASHTRYLDQDVLEMIHDFKQTAQERNIRLEMRHLPRYRRTFS